MTAPLTDGWSGLVVSGGNLDSTTYGQGGSFPSSWNTGRLFWRTDTHKLYKNSGTTSSPSWTELTLAGESITSGTVAAARIGNLDTSKLTSGTLGTARGGTGGTLPVANGGTGVASFTANKLLASNSAGNAIEHLPKPNLTSGSQTSTGTAPSGTADGISSLGHGKMYGKVFTFPTTARQFKVDQIITRCKNLSCAGFVSDAITTRAQTITYPQSGGSSHADLTFDFGDTAIFQGGQSIRYGVMCTSVDVSGHRFSSGNTFCASINDKTYSSTGGNSNFFTTIGVWGSESLSMPLQMKYTPMGEF